MVMIEMGIVKHWDASVPGGKLDFSSKQPGQNPESRQ
jgi:hypothetical protein